MLSRWFGITRFVASLGYNNPRFSSRGWATLTEICNYKHRKKYSSAYYSTAYIHYFFNLGRCKWTSMIGVSAPF